MNRAQLEQLATMQLMLDHDDVRPHMQLFRVEQRLVPIDAEQRVVPGEMAIVVRGNAQVVTELNESGDHSTVLRWLVDPAGQQFTTTVERR